MTHPLKQQADVVQGIAPAETFPTKAGEISALASAAAPFVVFDAAFAYAIKDDLGIVTLTCDRPVRIAEDGAVIYDRVITGNLRATVPALRQLRDTLNTVLIVAGDSSVTARMDQREQHREPVDLAAAPSPSDTRN